MFDSIDVIVGGQFGSESKGRVAAAVAQQREQEGSTVLGVRVGGPNAGHVVISHNDTRHALRTLPVNLVSAPKSVALIAAGSEIEVEVLQQEVEALEADGIDVRSRLLIDENATILEPRHKWEEFNQGLTGRLGSTGKGIGAARADRIMRRAKTARDMRSTLSKFGTVDNFTQAKLIQDQYAVVIEGTQGYGLGLHTKYYPKCTSNDTRAIDFLAMAGISPWAVNNPWDLQVHVVLRMYPIRVAGNSGPLEDETTWEELGLPEEKTTVTQKVRRVGQWDWDLAIDAVAANGPGAQIALAMADQRWPSLANQDDLLHERIDDQQIGELMGFIGQVEERTGARVTSIGTSPKSTVFLAEYGDWLQ